MNLQEHHITVQRTARYYTAGTLNENTKEIWIVVHGWAQLAGSFLQNFEALQNENRFFIAPEALNRFYLKGGFSEVGATWMTKEDREVEINDYVNYLENLYTELLEGKISADTKITVLGFSQGVTTVSRWVHQTKKHIDRLIFYAGEPAAELQNAESLQVISKIENYYFYGNEDRIISKEKLEPFKALLPQFQFIEFEGKHEVKGDVLAGFFK